LKELQNTGYNSKHNENQKIEVKILKHIQDREQRAVPLFKRNQPASLK